MVKHTIYGETYYLELTNKGIHDMQIKEVKEKSFKMDAEMARFR